MKEIIEKVIIKAGLRGGDQKHLSFYIIFIGRRKESKN